jgi:hypothetical protein
MSTGQNDQMTGLFVEGTRVILRDGRRATIVKAVPAQPMPHYLVRFDDGNEHEVNADDAIRAKTYAEWVAPGSGWDGEERRSHDDPPDVERRRP